MPPLCPAAWSLGVPLHEGSFRWQGEGTRELVYIRDPELLVRWCHHPQPLRRHKDTSAPASLPRNEALAMQGTRG